MEFGEVLSFYKTWDDDAVILVYSPDRDNFQVKITRDQLRTIFYAEAKEGISDPPQTATPSRW